MVSTSPSTNGPLSSKRTTPTPPSSITDCRASNRTPTTRWKSPPETTSAGPCPTQSSYLKHPKVGGAASCTSCFGWFRDWPLGGSCILGRVSFCCCIWCQIISANECVRECAVPDICVHARIERKMDEFRLDALDGDFRASYWYIYLVLATQKVMNVNIL